MRVLLADDDRDQLSLRSMLVARSGFDTLEAMEKRRREVMEEMKRLLRI